MKVLVFGSLNIDYTYQVDHMVEPGETLTSQSLSVNCGGKGLNQAIAFSKSGCVTYLAGQIGNDGHFLLDEAKKNHVNIEYVREDQTHTGNAIIQVNKEGNNCILLYPGSNRTLTKEYIISVLSHFNKGDYLILQNEINLLDFIIEEAYKKEMIICLNPSPYDDYINQCDLNKVSYLFVNEVEGYMMTSYKDENKIIESIINQYPDMHVLLTLGEKGSLYKDKDHTYKQDAIKTDVVDTTGAGDTFSSYFISMLIKGKSVQEAMHIAALASSITISKKGASISIPLLEEVLN